MKSLLRSIVGIVALSSVAPAILAGCGDDTNGAPGTGGSTNTGTGGSGAGTGAGGSGAGGFGGFGGSLPACDPAEVPCEDQIVLDLNLKPSPTDGLIENLPDGDGFVSNVDATAGGPFTTDPESYTYGRFTATGLEKVEIGDEDALASMEWDIAFRRYVVRINSGNSGPSCVKAAKVGSAYEDVSSVPGGLSYKADELFSDECVITDDGSGLPNSPKTALHDFWSYLNCVKMTGETFILALAGGRHVKLVVDRYYFEAAQQQCQQSDTLPQGDTGSGNYSVRWTELP